MSTLDVCKIQKLIKAPSVTIHERDERKIIDFILGSIVSKYNPRKVEVFKDGSGDYSSFRFQGLEWTVSRFEDNKGFPLSWISVETSRYSYGKRGKRNKDGCHRETISNNGQIDLVSLREGFKRVKEIQLEDSRKEKERERVEELRSKKERELEKKFKRVGFTVFVEIDDKKVKTEGDYLFRIDMSLDCLSEQDLLLLVKTVKQLGSTKQSKD